MSNLGDYKEDTTNLGFDFTTRDTSGVPTALSGTPAITVEKISDGTGKTSAQSYITLSEGTRNTVEIDLSGDVFFSAGEDYSVYISAGTVDGGTVVGEVVATFSIENRYTRGTENAATASVCTEARLSELDPANLPADVDATLVDTNEMQGKLPSSTLASSAEVTSISNTTKVRVVIPTALERPDSGSTLYTLDLFIYDTDGNMEAPDSLPTMTAKNESDADRSSNLGTVTLVSTGQYTVTYAVASGHVIEQVRFLWSIIEGGVTKLHGGSSMIVDTTAVDFTAADRTKLDTLHDTRLTATRAGNLDNLDGTVSSRMAEASISTTSGAVDNVTTVATTTTNTDMTAARLQAITDWIDGGRLDLLLDEILADTGTDGVKLNVSQPAGWPASLAASAGQVIEGTVDTVVNTHTPTTTVFQADDITEATADHFKDRIIVFTSGELSGEAKDITAYAAVGGIGQFTVTALTEPPADNDTFVIV